ncbi:MFS transporter, partial [Amycolatopsis magusensis]|nr:MFS transporter [Amycolatopsis magusensis]
MRFGSSSRSGKGRAGKKGKRKWTPEPGSTTRHDPPPPPPSRERPPTRVMPADRSGGPAPAEQSYPRSRTPASDY